MLPDLYLLKYSGMAEAGEGGAGADFDRSQPGGGGPDYAPKISAAPSPQIFRPSTIPGTPALSKC